jgi:hypothetical protein
LSSDATGTVMEAKPGSRSARWRHVKGAAVA